LKFKKAALQKAQNGIILPGVKEKQTAADWLRECFEYENTHPIAFASPGALREARLIAELEKARSPRRQARRKAAVGRRSPNAIRMKRSQAISAASRKRV
jgi:hypothetical protein